MEKQNQMPTGTWDKIDTDDSEKVKFDVNITQRVVVLNPTPLEKTGEDGGVYYKFEVEQDKKKKVIQTSAWTLLRALKKANIKAGMVLDVTKRLEKGKQFFTAVEVK
jgi:hypothetical protein